MTYLKYLQAADNLAAVSQTAPVADAGLEPFCRSSIALGAAEHSRGENDAALERLFDAIAQVARRAGVAVEPGTANCTCLICRSCGRAAAES